MPFEAGIVMDARDTILVLSDQFLHALGERSLIVCAIRPLQGAADPILGSGLVKIVLCLIAAPVRRRLIQLRRSEPAVQPCPNPS
jgi:hypothetical protein